MTAVAHINGLGTANPPYEVHDAFVRFVAASFGDDKERRLFEKMVGRAGIERRYSYLEPVTLSDGTITDTDDFYGLGDWPSTGARMARYERHAPELALSAIGQLGGALDPAQVTHLVVASCTGFMAPGLDQEIVARLKLNPGVERSVLGFMGCYAAVNALRTAHHIVRSTPTACVLVVTLELCTLHFQRTHDLERLLSMLLFGDGAAAAIVTANPAGIALQDFRATTIAGSADAITWSIRDQGFDMHLGGEVPVRIKDALHHEASRNDADGLFRENAPGNFDLWAIHAGGRTVLDAVQQGLDLAPEALTPSRSVLRDFGNMSSATLMFVLAQMMRDRPDGMDEQAGIAMAFGPGLAAESFRFTMLA
jgi:predicted naringenin-chalcone synthase